MPSEPVDTLHEVTEVAVIRHRDLGVLLLHSADRRWHFPDSTVRVGEPWDESLRRAVRSVTGIRDLTIGRVLLIQNFGPGEVDQRPQFGIFLLCNTHTPDVADAHRWVRDVAELERLELFHPLVADLVGWALDDRSGDR
jgi:ADP-ribose pyrophosphatase YjhB (NUDIX family)